MADDLLMHFLRKRPSSEDDSKENSVDAPKPVTPSKRSCYRIAENSVHYDTPAIEGVKSRIKSLAKDSSDMRQLVVPLGSNNNQQRGNELVDTTNIPVSERKALWQDMINKESKNTEKLDGGRESFVRGSSRSSVKARLSMFESAGATPKPTLVVSSRLSSDTPRVNSSSSSCTISKAISESDNDDALHNNDDVFKHDKTNPLNEKSTKRTSIYKLINQSTNSVTPNKINSNLKHNSHSSDFNDTNRKSNSSSNSSNFVRDNVDIKPNSCNGGRGGKNDDDDDNDDENDDFSKQMNTLDKRICLISKLKTLICDKEDDGYDDYDDNNNDNGNDNTESYDAKNESIKLIDECDDDSVDDDEGDNDVRNCKRTLRLNASITDEMEYITNNNDDDDGGDEDNDNNHDDLDDDHKHDNDGDVDNGNDDDGSHGGVGDDEVKVQAMFSFLNHQDSIKSAKNNNNDNNNNNDTNDDNNGNDSVFNNNNNNNNDDDDDDINDNDDDNDHIENIYDSIRSYSDDGDNNNNGNDSHHYHHQNDNNYVNVNDKPIMVKGDNIINNNNNNYNINNNNNNINNDNEALLRKHGGNVTSDNATQRPYSCSDILDDIKTETITNDNNNVISREVNVAMEMVAMGTIITCSENKRSTCIGVLGEAERMNKGRVEYSPKKYGVGDHNDDDDDDGSDIFSHHQHHNRLSSSGSVDDDGRLSVKALLEKIQVEESILQQSKNALIQCNKLSNVGNNVVNNVVNNVARCDHYVECHRLILISKKKIEAYEHQLQTRRSDSSISDHVTNCSGRIIIKDLSLPLHRDIMFTEDTHKHYFIVHLKSGSQLIFSQVLNPPKSEMSLEVPGPFKFERLDADFKITVEIYSMSLSNDFPNSSSSSSSSSSNGVKKRPLLTPKKRFLPSKSPIKISDRFEFQKLNTSFYILGLLELSVDTIGCGSVGVKFDQVPSNVRKLEGIMTMNILCEVQYYNQYTGFLTMFEDVNGFGAWHRRWCLLKGDKLIYWKYPDDEKNNKDAIGCIDLLTCIYEPIGPIPRDICARPHTFQLVSVRSKQSNEKETLVSKLHGNVVTTKHWLSADTKDERVTWCDNLNDVLQNINRWNKCMSSVLG